MVVEPTSVVRVEPPVVMVAKTGTVLTADPCEAPAVPEEPSVAPVVVAEPEPAAPPVAEAAAAEAAEETAWPLLTEPVLAALKAEAPEAEAAPAPRNWAQ